MLVRRRAITLALTCAIATGTAAIAIASGIALPRSAYAQDARAGDAERLFREGRALMDAGDTALACPKFAESEKLDPAPGTLLSLADCEERSKWFVRAREHYQLAASGFPKKDPRRSFSAGRAQALDSRVAHLTLRLPPTASSDAVVRLHGEVADAGQTTDVTVLPAELGGDRAVDPGVYRVTVSAKGHADNVLSVALAEGDTRELLCEVGAADRAAPPPPPPPAPAASTRGPSGPRRTLAFVLLGVGGASVVVGGIAGILAAGKASTVKDHCNGDYLCDQQGVDAASSGNVLSPLSTVSLIAGVALAGAGAYLFLAKPPPKPARSALFRLDPLVSTDSAGVRVTKAF